jgi:hypothetical protein
MRQALESAHKTNAGAVLISTFRRNINNYHKGKQHEKEQARQTATQQGYGGEDNPSSC